MQPDVSLRSRDDRKTMDVQLQQQVENGLNQLRSDVAERPFLYVAVAFLAGFVCNTLPARFLLLAVMRLASWLLGPAILLMGVVKFTDLFSSSRRRENI